MTRPFQPDDATRAQIDAAEPGVSTWLSANAGSGKTRVLTDRVARLLLHETPPERILCLTYTKAAASEMQNRLFKRLGEWAMQDDATLRQALIELGEGPDLGAALLARARRLFARAIETPGGLKIQTIHAFCSAILRRFPLEAGVSPGFAEMDDRAGIRLVEEVLDEMADGDGRAAIDIVAPLVSGDDGLVQLAKAVLTRREELSGDAPDIRTWFGMADDLTEDAIAAEAIGAASADLLAALRDALSGKLGARDQKTLDCLTFVDWANPDMAGLERLIARLTTKPKVEPRRANSQIITKGVRAKLGDQADAFDQFVETVVEAHGRKAALAAARRTEALYAFADDFLPRMEAAKAARGWLDFDDLIHRTRHLLIDRPMAQWVLFRLDGGIDHILVDEAQDTSPAQWQIVRQLAAEFAGGEGARADTRRTIFVVGDKKQSIYSFQGADPDGFDRMQAHFSDQISAAGGAFFPRELQYSFRSAPPILQLVDKVFRGPAGQGIGHAPTHLAHKADMPGRIDLWPVVPRAETPAKNDWPRPVDATPGTHHTVILADRIVAAIRDMIEARVPVGPPDRRWAVRPGDILILVQRRSGLYTPLAAALKASGLPFAGADVFRVAADLAVRDLTSLLRFLATAEDDLSLAEALRSPLFGWTEAELYALAQPRRRGLWEALRQLGGPTVETLTDLRDQTDFLRPYDLIERILIRHDGRRRLLQRLGPEAEEGIDAMLDQALAYERAEVPSLLGFTGWLGSDEVKVKRTLTGEEDLIRLMTVHGAKGLEAPVVILPDTALPTGGKPHLSLLAPEGGPVIWPPRVDDQPQRIAGLVEARKNAEAAERRRLLYVAMTRAENWLIVAGAGEIGDDPAKSWYGAVGDALTAMGAAPYPVADLGEGLRYQTGDWSPLPEDRGTDPGAPAIPPDWATRPADPVPAEPAIRSPSDLGGAKALPGEGAELDEAAALRRGTLIHRLLEHLPAHPRARWDALALGLLGLDAKLEETEIATLLPEARAVLDAPGLAPLFAPDTLAEVSVAGPSPTLGCRLAGQIDRLVVAPDHVLAVDFKSNAVVPAMPEQVPDGLLRQLGAYAELLVPLYPGRDIRTALLWTRTATLMEVPAALSRTALSRAAPT